ncbi:MAG: PAS domain S-box protein [Magnetococcales bacterium]|nr:PAS domain S-box protein [Magnetococcales bacterium]
MNKQESNTHLVLEFLGTLSKMENERACLDYTLDFFNQISGARLLGCITILDNKPSELIVKTLGDECDHIKVAERLSTFNEEHHLTKCGTGFLLSVTNHGNVLAKLEISQIDQKENISEYLNIAIMIKSVLGVCIAKARSDTELNQKQQLLDVKQQELKEALDSVKRINRHFSLSLEAANSGSWSQDLISGEIIWDEGVERIFGIEAGSFAGTAMEWEKLVHPDDLEGIIEAIQEAVKVRSTINHEYRIANGSDSWKHINTFGKILCDEKNNPIRIVGICMDMTERVKSENAIKKLADRYKTILTASQDGYWIVDSNGKIIEVNDAYVQVSGYSRKEILSMSIADLELFVSELDIKERLNLLSSSGWHTFITKHRTKSGKIIDIELSTGVMEHGPAPLYFAFLKDASRRVKQTNIERLRSERFHSLHQLSTLKIENINQITDFTLNHTVALTNSNIGFLGFLNEDETKLIVHVWSNNAMNEQTIHSMPYEYPLEQAGLWGDAVRQRKTIIYNENSKDVEKKRGIPYGHIKIDRLITVPAILENKVLAIISVANKKEDYDADDVKYIELISSEMVRHNQEQKILQNLTISENRFRKSIMEAPLPVMLHAEDGEVLMVNSIWTNMTGYIYDNIATIDSWLELAFSWKEDTTAEKKYFQSIYNSNESSGEGEFEIVSISGQRLIWNFSSSSLGKLPDGRKLAVSMAVDITERKIAENALRESEQKLLKNIAEQKLIEKNLQMSERRFKSIIEQSGDGISLFSSDLCHALVNPAYCEMLGYSQKELLGHSVLDFLPNNSTFRIFVEGFEGESEIREHQFIHKDGSRFYVETRAYPIEYQNQQYVLVSSRNITARKLAEEKSRRLMEAREVISKLLQLSLVPSKHEHLLDDALSLLLSVPWLEIQNKGAIFLCNEAGTELRLAAHHGFPNNMQTNCANIPFGHCLCGMAAQNKQFIFTNNIDELHQNRFPDMKPHGHYIIPILVEEHLLGVINIYLHAGHQRNEEEEKFLQTFATTVASIIERRTAEMERIKTNLANQAKSEFLASMSHEIRTPMNAVIGLADLALETATQPKIRDYLNKILASSNSLLRIINDILDFSKIEAGKTELENKDFFVHEIFDHLLDIFRIQAKDRGLELIITYSLEQMYVLIGDSLRLEQIIRNLLSNALKFTETGSIELFVKTLNVTADLVELEFAVHDTGMGITKAQTDILFTPFSQADISIAKNYGGTGLGLAICKRLVEVMNGKIWVDSVPNQGSTFRFTAVFGRNLAAETSKNTLTPPEDLNKMKVLVVGNNSINNKSLEGMLHLFSFETITANSWEEADKLLHDAQEVKSEFQLILIAHHMPDVDGIYSMKGVPRPKIILIDSYDDDKNIQNQFDVELIDAHLTLPINCTTLFDTIMDIFGNKMFKSRVKEINKFSSDMVSEKIGGARILLVEDTLINLQVAGEYLEGAGLEVLVAQNGKEAVKMAFELPLDAILMDMHMPEMDGYMATKLIREKISFDKLPIIALTANAMIGDREKCLACGMNDHVAKPIDTKKLFSALLQWIPPRKQNILPAPTDIIHYEEIFPDFSIPTNQIDIIHALEKLDGNKALLWSVLMEFLKDFADADKTIKSAIIDNVPPDIKGAKAVLHNIKGISGTIHATDLFEITKSFEDAIRMNRSELWPDFLPQFEKAIGQVVKFIEQLKQTLD